VEAGGYQRRLIVLLSQSGQAGIGVVGITGEPCISLHDEFCLIVQALLKRRHEHVWKELELHRNGYMHPS
jgi:hypothetical protein